MKSDFDRSCEADFISGFKFIQRTAYETNEKNGFNSEDHLIDEFEKFLLTQVRSDVNDKFKALVPAFKNARTGLKLMLATGELSETLEAVRKNLGQDDHCHEFTAEEVEVADNFIRLMNYASGRGLRLAEAIVAKNKYNRDRHDHSKEGRAEEHGKRF